MARRLAAFWPFAAWTSWQVTFLGLGFLAGWAIRLWWLPEPGYFGDINQFVAWVRHIQEGGLTRAYDEHLAFGPVMVYLWGLLGVLDPAFRAGADASDVGIRIVMKLPATLADLGLAAAVAYALRTRPTWAIVGATGLLVIPATGFVSAWWGQYDSIFALPVLLAFLFAARGRDELAVVALTAALMTKPQVAPLVIPFAAWFIARWHLAGLVRLGAIGALAALVLWLPFLAEGGPANYLAGLASFQDERYAKLSLNAWNGWWMVQDLVGGGREVADSGAFVGPFTYRAAGYLLTGGLLLAIGYRVWRRPTPRMLALGLAAAALVAFSFLTTMHERYGYAAVVLLALLVDDPRLRLPALAVGIATSLNLFAAASVPKFLEPTLPINGVAGWAGSLVIVGVAGFLVWELFRPDAAADAADERSAVNALVTPADPAAAAGRGTPRGTSAGSGAATSGA